MVKPLLIILGLSCVMIATVSAEDVHPGFWLPADSGVSNFDDCGFISLGNFGCIIFNSDHYGAFTLSCDVDIFDLVGHFRLVGDVGGDCCMGAYLPCLSCSEIMECEYCCRGSTMGNIDCFGIIDIGDVTVMIQNLFITLNDPCCEAEADIDQSGLVDIGDLTMLISSLFITLNPLPECP